MKEESRRQALEMWIQKNRSLFMKTKTENCLGKTATEKTADDRN